MTAPVFMELLVFKLPHNSLLLKALVIGGLAILMMIPLGMVEGLIAERASRRNEAIASVQASFAGPQTVTLPFFVWPYVEQWSEQTVDAAGRARVTPMSEQKVLVWFADQAQAAVDVTVKNDRYRGIHRVRTYESTLAINGAMTWPDRSQVKPSADGRRIVWGEPRLALPISDVRGLRGTPAINFNDQPQRFREGTHVPMLAAGLHVLLADQAPAMGVRFSISLELAGTERLAFAPTATSNAVTVKSAWRDPHFGGSYLPRDRTVTESGFSADWAISALASDVQQQVRQLASQTQPDRRPQQNAPSRLDTFEIDFIEAVNTYLLAERSTKHGAMIIVLVFGAMFLFDTLRALNAHPVQYGFVGLALVIFFLLLLSLSEHVAFGAAYSIAASSCTLLITYYLSYVLANRPRALGFGCALAAMYATIYSILIAEGTALLMGSVLLFVMLAAAMIVTRKLDWRRIGPSMKPGEA
ncbi:MAG TPA: cell envelope integrity protein CreD [Burkholderiaceae bacterium]|nr:cell envelope integrity protein CreD [Burkholderiaceae bacterium]